MEGVQTAPVSLVEGQVASQLDVVLDVRRVEIGARLLLQQKDSRRTATFATFQACHNN